MAFLNGAAITEGIRRACPNARIVVMSSEVTRGAGGGSHVSEAIAVLKKPFYPADVDAVLERYFGLAEVTRAG